ncbi:TPA: hypothetical protein QCN45_001220 [Bacillus cereus]|nr:hypothetical protein [Bacillus cereus]
MLNKKPVHPPKEDKVLLDKLLHEEISKKFNEISSIMAKTLDQNAKDSFFEITITKRSTETDDEFEVKAMMPTGCAIYRDPPGVCEPC